LGIVPDICPIGNLIKLHQRIEKKYKSSGTFTLGKSLKLLFDPLRRPPVDLNEKFLDFLAEFGLLKRIADYTKKYIFGGNP
jgi:hypothetical protein